MHDACKRLLTTLMKPGRWTGWALLANKTNRLELSVWNLDSWLQSRFCLPNQVGLGHLLCSCAYYVNRGLSLSIACWRNIKNITDPRVANHTESLNCLAPQKRPVTLCGPAAAIAFSFPSFDNMTGSGWPRQAPYNPVSTRVLNPGLHGLRVDTYPGPEALMPFHSIARARLRLKYPRTFVPMVRLPAETSGAPFSFAVDLSTLSSHGPGSRKYPSGWISSWEILSWCW